jgi:long-chain acyl-CoA synthetase
MPNRLDLRTRPAPERSTTQTINALIDASVAANPDRIAMKSRVLDEDVSIPYRELRKLLAALAAGLVALGLDKGDRVALLSENRPEWGLAYAAVLSAGGVVVPLDPQLSAAECGRLLRHSESKLLFVSPALRHEKMEGAGPVLVRSILIDEVTVQADTGGVPERAAEVENEEATMSGLIAAGRALVARGDAESGGRAAAVSADDAAAICYTSGTTGQPKGVVLLHRNIAANVESCMARLPFRDTDVFLCILPLHHMMTTTCSLLAPLAAGSCIYFGRSVKSRDIRADIAREGITVIVGVPLLFEHMARSIEKRLAEAPAPARFLFRASKPAIALLARLSGRNVARGVHRKRIETGGLESLRFCISGAAALRNGVEDTFRSIGLCLLQGYGMTEAAPVVSVNPAQAPRSGTIGPPLPGVEVRIDEPDDEGIGEILVRGPNVMWGYYKNPDATERVLRDGWLATGDLGWIDAKGYITFVGRKKSVIVPAGGKNVYPDEIEALLATSPYILESIVLAAKDGRGNERVAAIVVPDLEAIASSPECGGASPESVERLIGAEIKRICRELPEYKRVRDFRIRTEELPKTTTRKVKRHLVVWPE